MSNTNNSHKFEAKLAYQVPTITTYTAEELLNIVGPVHAGNDQEDNLPMGGTSGMGSIHKILKVV